MQASSFIEGAMPLALRYQSLKFGAKASLVGTALRGVDASPQDSAVDGGIAPGEVRFSMRNGDMLNATKPIVFLSCVLIASLSVACGNPPPPPQDGGMEGDAAQDAPTDPDGEAAPPDASDNRDGGAEDAPSELVGLEPASDSTTLVTLGWIQRNAGTARIEVREGRRDWRLVSERATEAGAHRRILFGLPYDTAFEARVTVAYADGTTETFGPFAGRTPAPPAGMPTSFPVTAATSAGNAFFKDSDVDTWRLMVDRAGRVVWGAPARSGPYALIHQVDFETGNAISVDLVSRSAGGDAASPTYGIHITFDAADALFSEWSGRTPPADPVVVSNVVGPTLAVDAASQIVGVMLASRRRDPDAVLSVVTPGATPSNLWRCSEWMRSLRGPISGGCGTPMHLAYHPEKRVFLLTVHDWDSVLVIDAETGEVRQAIGALAAQVSGSPTLTQPLRRPLTTTVGVDGTLFIYALGDDTSGGSGAGTITLRVSDVEDENWRFIEGEYIDNDYIERLGVTPNDVLGVDQTPDGERRYVTRRGIYVLDAAGNLTWHLQVPLGRPDAVTVPPNAEFGAIWGEEYGLEPVSAAPVMVARSLPPDAVPPAGGGTPGGR